MRDIAGDSAAWAALLPVGTVWLPGHRRSAARRLRSAMADLPAASALAVAASPRAFGRAVQTARPGAVTAYIAIPSRQRPVLVASSDPAVLRYVASSVLSVPPGTGPLPGMVLTAGLRLLRFRWVWMLAAAARAAGVVLVGRRG
jgi:hypothetical protein